MFDFNDIYLKSDTKGELGLIDIVSVKKIT